MAEHKSLIVRYLREVVRHGLGLWTGAGLTFGAWILDHLIEAEWWLHPSPMFYVVVGSLGLAFAQFMTWRSLALEKTEKTQGRLSVRPSLNSLTNAWPKHQALALLTAGLYKRSFAVLRVKNEGARNFAGVVAECVATEVGKNMHCNWSKESGEDFVLGGGHAGDLNVGDFRLLVVAQAIGGSGVWLRLPDREPFHNPPLQGRSPEGGDDLFFSSSTDLLNLGSESEVAVRFRAEGLDQTVYLRLSFRSGRPEVTVLPSRRPYRLRKRRGSTRRDARQ